MSVVLWRWRLAHRGRGGARRLRGTTGGDGDNVGHVDNIVGDIDVSSLVVVVVGNGEGASGQSGHGERGAHIDLNPVTKDR
jgi:hypothetical protein